MPTAETLINAWPGWAALAVAVLLTVNKLAEESEKFANRFGRIGRWLRKKAIERRRVDAVAAVVAEAVRVELAKARAEWEREFEAARDKWESEQNEAMVALNGRLSTVSRITAQQRVDLEEMRFSYNCCLAYADYESTWHNRLLAIIAKSGTMALTDLPHNYSYFDFEKQYKTNTNWRKWAFDD